MLKSSIAPMLRAAGFSKRRNSFARSNAGGWELIDFQASQFGTRDNVSFTINLGVVFTEISGLEGRTATLGRAHVRQRIGPLLGHRQDKWWDLDAGSDYDAVAADVAAALRSTAIPWLEGRTTLAQVLEGVRSDPTGFLESWHLGRLSVLLEGSGRQDEATELRDVAERLQRTDG